MCLCFSVKFLLNVSTNCCGAGDRLGATVCVWPVGIVQGTISIDIFFLMNNSSLKRHFSWGGIEREMVDDNDRSSKSPKQKWTYWFDDFLPPFFVYLLYC